MNILGFCVNVLFIDSALMNTITQIQSKYQDHLILKTLKQKYAKMMQKPTSRCNLKEKDGLKWLLDGKLTTKWNKDTSNIYFQPKNIWSLWHECQTATVLLHGNRTIFPVYRFIGSLESGFHKIVITVDSSIRFSFSIRPFGQIIQK